MSEPTPWFSFDANKWLEKLDLSNFNIFEFGSGNSTVWFSKRCESIISVEHDHNWYTQVFNKTDKNCKLILKPLPYFDIVNNPAIKGKKFDMIIVDGRNRVKCAQASYELLKPNGYFILDDAQRNYYSQVKEDIEKLGWSFLKDIYNIPGGVSDFERQTAIWQKI